MTSRQNIVVQYLAIIAAMLFASPGARAAALEDEFRSPPHPAKPWVYWINMDGHFTKEGITADLESMKAACIGGMIHMDVDVGVPRGNVPFMSKTWQENFKHAVLECERLGLEFTTITGPGWTGTGGPWVKANGSMQHLLPVSVDTKGPATFNEVLPIPQPRVSGYHSNQTPEMRETLNAFYEDVAVYAFPRRDPVVENIDEKALFVRNPYTSMAGVRTHFPAPASFPETDNTQVIDPSKIIDLTSRLQADGRLQWEVPPGEWTILRMGRRSTGANTRPAPAAGLGFESNKFDKRALESHFEAYFDPLLKSIGPRSLDRTTGFTGLDADSWEMGAQNWTPGFREEFKKRRSYDPWPYFPAYSGRVVGSREMTERFLWDVRVTCQELLLENHIAHMKTLCHARGLKLTIEPYDMTPVNDLDLGSYADIPQGEFWLNTFNSSWSCIEAASIGHIMGKPIVAAEAFTAAGTAWTEKPSALKNQGDWAFAAGINRFVIVAFSHQPWLDRAPGMTFGSYGLNWERTQTFWPLLGGYHQYLARCSHLLQQGVTVSDVLYLTPEGAPHVFRAPDSALNDAASMLPDKKGYGFDGCSPKVLMARAGVKDGRIAFPGGSSYRLLVLPRCATMTSSLLDKLTQLVEAGAVVYGSAPAASPSLSGYPECDAKVRELANNLWGKPNSGVRQLGKGRIIPDPAVEFRNEKADANAPMLPTAGSWIWLNEGNPAASAPAGNVNFRYTWEIPDLALVKKARIEATADNTFTLKVNDKLVLSGDNFHNIYSADVLSALRPGKNTITVLANNTGPNANPAGFIAAMRLGKADGSQEVIGSDQRWSASRNAADWSAAKPLGPGNMAPWLLSRSASPAADLYPAYATTAAVLEEMSVPQDFQSDGPIRHAHRETAEKDLYFIANTTGSKVKATCTFRVEKGTPELWDPVTAEIRALTQFTHQGKTTSLPVMLEPHQSFFVIFPREGKSGAAAGTKGANFSEPKPVVTLEGSWDVAFDPKWGGPEKSEVRGQRSEVGREGTAVFEKLVDWTTREERGIQYYSGIATYRKVFDLPEEAAAASREPGRKIYLDLGVVHEIARIRLNGKDLGIVWCAPWRIDISNALKEGRNDLEIEVANLWPNRLIGDNARAADQRFTWTIMGHPYGTDSKLLRSGLLGPVRILANELRAP